MKKFYNVWIAMMFIFIPAIAQDESGDSCRADYSWKVNDKIMMFAPGMAINFYDRSEPEPVFWHWDFGDGSYSEEQNPMHIFNFLNPGANDFDSSFYFPTVCLTVVSKSGCKTIICKTLDIMNDSSSYPGDCYVSFYSYYDDSVYWEDPDLIPYSFRIAAPENTISYLWDFGDGESSTEANPLHGYNAYVDIAYYNACVTITTIDSCVSTFCAPVYMDNRDSSVNADCQASFTWTIMESYPLTFGFRDLSLGNTVAWSWDFGDGTYSNLQNPNHVFNGARDTIYPDGYLGPPIADYYKVCLTSLTDDNCKSIYCEYVYSGGIIDTIYPEPCPYFISVTTSNILGGNFCNGTAAASLVDADGNPVETAEIYWSTGDTGDKTSGLCVNMPYYVSINSAEGCQVVGSFAIIDYTRPMQPFGFWTIYGDGSWYDLTYALPDSGYTCTWEFSDGTSINGENVNYAFPGDSEKSVTINVRDEQGNIVYTESIDLNKSTGLKNPEVTEFSLYPNPVGDNINIRVKSSVNGSVMVEIYNSIGQSYMKRNFSDVAPNSEISLSSARLDRGVYFARIIVPGENPVSIPFVK